LSLQLFLSPSDGEIPAAGLIRHRNAAGGVGVFVLLEGLPATPTLREHGYEISTHLILAAQIIFMLSVGMKNMLLVKLRQGCQKRCCLTGYGGDLDLQLFQLLRFVEKISFQRAVPGFCGCLQLLLLVDALFVIYGVCWHGNQCLLLWYFTLLQLSLMLLSFMENLQVMNCSRLIFNFVLALVQLQHQIFK